MSKYSLGKRRISVVAGAAGAAFALAGAYVAAPALAALPAEARTDINKLVAGTPCTAAATACVSLAGKHAWLIKDGAIFRGPVPISSGGAGKETPTGDGFTVLNKDKDFKSTEFKMPNGQPAPMPYSVFFEPGGIAFHAGNPNVASAGCIHLNLADAMAFYNYLQVGNNVQVKAGRSAETTVSKKNSSGNSETADEDNDNNDKENDGKDSKGKKKNGKGKNKKSGDRGRKGGGKKNNDKENDGNDEDNKDHDKSGHGKHGQNQGGHGQGGHSRKYDDQEG